MTAETTTRRVLRARDAMDADPGAPWDLDLLARIALLSPSHFRRRFRAVTGLAPRAYLVRRRMDIAARLLEGTPLPVTEVSRAVGYASLGTFTRTFREHAGTSPAAYRARGVQAAVPWCFRPSVTRRAPEQAAPVARG